MPIKQLFGKETSLKVYHHYLQKKNTKRLWAKAQKTVGQGEAKVDDQTCAGDEFRNWLSASASPSWQLPKAIPKLTGSAERKKLSSKPEIKTSFG